MSGAPGRPDRMPGYDAERDRRVCEIASLLAIAANCIEAARLADDLGQQRLGEAGWRVADAAQLLAELCDAERVTGVGITGETGRGAMLPFPRSAGVEDASRWNE